MNKKNNLRASADSLANWQPVYELTVEVLARQAEVERLVRAHSEYVFKRDLEMVLRSRPKRLRVVKCTQELFDLLPGLVSRQEFRDWTGLSENDLLAEVRANRIQIYRPSDHGYRLYYKHEIARLTGFKL